MRVLVVTIPGAGHLRPMLPLVAAMTAAGDEVTVAAHASLEEPVSSAGAVLWPTGHDEAAWFGRLAARTRGAPGDGLAPARIDHYFVPRVFGEIGADDMVDDLLACATARRPDLVVFESYAFAAPLVAAVLGVPTAQHAVGELLDQEVLALVDDAVSPLWRAFDQRTPGLAGVYEGATVEICPPSLAGGRPPRGTRLAVRPAPPPLEGATPEAVPARPLVYVTLGTAMANASVIQTVLSALADEPLDVVCTTGSSTLGGDEGEALEVPANATVEAYVPQGELLPRCAAVVHHGGAGTTFGALAHGLPQVVCPQGADNFRNAARLEACGASVTVAPESLDEAAVRDAVRAVLGDPGHRRSAQALRREIEVMPTPDVLAADLRSFAETRAQGVWAGSPGVPTRSE